MRTEFDEIRSVPLDAGGANPPRATETILLVDDDSAVRRLSGRVLRGVGYLVFERLMVVKCYRSLRATQNGFICSCPTLRCRG